MGKKKKEEGSRSWMYVCMYVCMFACLVRSSWPAGHLEPGIAFFAQVANSSRVESSRVESSRVIH